MEGLVGFIIGVLIVVAAIIFWYIATKNDLRCTEIKVEESLADIDVALIKRHDVLTKMLDLIKSYVKYEKEIMLETIRLRSGMSMKERNSRRLYNGNIARLNQKIVSFPSSIVANRIQMSQKEFLVVDEAKRQDVKMDI